MIIITLKKTDATQLQGKLQKGDNVVYPTNLTVARLLREILSINQKVNRLSNALLWKRLKYEKYEELMAKAENSLKKLKELNIEVAKVLQEIYPTNTTNTGGGDGSRGNNNGNENRTPREEIINDIGD